jgi:hypothetical protein
MWIPADYTNELMFKLIYTSVRFIEDEYPSIERTFPLEAIFEKVIYEYFGCNKSEGYSTNNLYEQNYYEECESWLKLFTLLIAESVNNIGSEKSIKLLRDENSIQLVQKWKFVHRLKKSEGTLLSLNDLEAATKFDILKFQKMQLNKKTKDPLESFEGFSQWFNDNKNLKHSFNQNDKSQTDNKNEIQKKWEEIVETEIKIYKTVLGAIKNRNADNLWSDCFKLLSETFNYDDIQIFLEKISYHSGSQEKSNYDNLTLETYFENFIGEFSRIVIEILYYELELKFGNSSKVRDVLGDLVIIKRPEVWGVLLIKSYFDAIGINKKEILDKAFELSLKNSAYYDKASHEYLDRVKQSFENVFEKEIIIKIKTHPKHAGVSQQCLNIYKDYIGKQLEAGIDPFLELPFYGKKSVSEDVPNKDLSHQKNNIPTISFYKSGVKWWVGEKGKEEPFKNSKGEEKGFRYLHMLLNHPDQDLFCWEIINGGKILLLTDRQKNYSKMSNEEFESNEPALAKGKKGKSKKKLEEIPLILKIKEEIEIFKKAQEKLKDELTIFFENSEISADKKIEAEEETNREINVLENRIKLYKQSLQDCPTNERTMKNARISVLKNIDNALDKIHSDIPELKEHLIKKINILTGIQCSYTRNPLRPVNWILFPENHTK